MKSFTKLSKLQKKKTLCVILNNKIQAQCHLNKHLNHANHVGSNVATYYPRKKNP